MPDLGHLIREIQREAAALPTDKLRDEIEINLEVQDAAIRQYLSLGPVGRVTVTDLIATSSAVMVSALTTALYTAELATRPAQPRFVVASNPN